MTQAMSINEVFDKIEVFKNLPSDELATLRNSASLKTYLRNELVYSQNEKPDFVFVLVTGIVKTGMFDQNGQEAIRHVLHPFDFFGEHFLADTEVRPEFACAMKDTADVLRIPLGTFKEVMYRCPELMRTTLNLYASRIFRNELRLDDMVLRDARGRIVGFFKEQGARIGLRYGDEILIRHGLTHQEIANVTGTSRQLITIVMNQMRKEGLINFDRTSVLVKDLDKLA